MTPLAALLVAAVAPLADPPRLLRLDATATLGPGGLTGTLALHARGFGRLPLEPFAPAVTAGPVRPGPAVAVAGDTRVSLDWSLRGTDTFALALPPAAVRTLTLDLPAGHTPVAAAAVSGPADGRRWVIQFGGRDPLSLTIRKPPDPTAGPLARVNRVMRWELAPGVARWSVEFAVEPIRGPFTPALVLPPGLTVTEQTATNGRVTASGFAPPPTGPWTPPRVALAGSLPGADTLTVTLAPELALIALDAGSNRLSAADRALTFAGPGSPTLTVAAAGPEVRTAEEQAWRVGRDESVLSVKLTATVARGPLDRLVFRLSPGFTPTAVRATPEDPGLTHAAADGRLTVTPSRAVPTGGKLTLDLELTAAPPVPAGDPADPAPPPLRVPVPTLGVDAADRTGTVAVAAGPGLTLWPAGPPTPFTGTPPPASVLLAPARPRVIVTSDIAVSPVPGGLAVRATGLADPADAPLDRLTLFAPAGWTLAADGAAVRPVPGSGLALAAAGLPLDGQLIHVVPPRPTTDAIRLTAVGFVPAVPGRVPLPVVLGADSRPPGLRADRLPLDIGPPTSDLPPALELRPRGQPPAVPGGWAFADPSLSARVGPAGRDVTFAVTVERAVGSRLPLALPAGAELVAASVGGKRAEWASGLPLPDGGGRVEVRYRLPPARRATAVRPGLPADPGPAPVRWAFDPGVRRWPTLDTGEVEADEVWVIPEGEMRAVGYLLAVAVALAGRWRWLAVGVGLLAAAGWVAPGSWPEVLRPAVVVGLLALAVRRRPVPAVARRLPSTAAYATASVSLLMVAAAPPARFDAAEYELAGGDGGTVAVAARFDLSVTAAGPVSLPLSGVRLESVELGGTPVPATAVAGGYVLELPAGTHAVACRFAVPRAGDRVRFGVPDVPRCRVTAAGADVVSRRGVQRGAVADHGGGTAVEVRWPGVATPPARELTVWEVAEVTSRGRFAVWASGPVEVTLPAGVEVGNGPFERTPGRVRAVIERPGWVVLPLATVGPVLRCPTAGAGESVVAVRGAVTVAGLTEATVEALKPFAEALDTRSLRAFTRRSGMVAELTVASPPATADALTAETVWTVGPELVAAGTVRAERTTAGVLAFDLPESVTLLDVRAADGSRWTRSGTRVTVRLPAPAGPVAVTWVGTLSAVGEFDLPGPGGTVRAEPADGWAVVVKEQAPGRLRVAAYPSAPPPATLRESVERAGDAVQWRATVELPLAAGRPHRFRVTVSDVPAGVKAGVEWAATEPVAAIERVGDDWLVTATGPVLLTPSATLPPGRLPEVGVRWDGPPVGWVRRELTAGAGLVVDSDDRRVSLPDPPKPPPPAAAEPPAIVAATADWPAAVGWLAVFGVVVAVRPAGPERLTGVGVLAAAAVGGTLGWGFLLLAAVGLAWRLGRWAVR